MSGRTFAIALLFTMLSGAFWWVIGQLLPFVAPMMLDDSEMLSEHLLMTLGALAFYMIAAMLFFGWLLRQKGS